MNTLLKILGAVALIGCIAVCGSLSVLIVRASNLVAHVDKDRADARVAVITAAPLAKKNMTDLIGAVRTTVDKAEGAIDSLSRPCPGENDRHPRPCGTIADINKTLATIRGATGQIETAAIHENRRLSVMDGQEEKLFDDTHALLQRSSDELDSLHQATNDLDKFITAPDLAATVSNVQVMTKNGGEMTGTFNAVTKKATKSYLAPPPPPTKNPFKIAGRFLKANILPYLPLAAKAVEAMP